MIPPFKEDGSLPEGIHSASWKEIRETFGFNEHMRRLLAGMREAFSNLKSAGCRVVYLNGSFTSTKAHPNDFDACWDPRGVNPSVLDPVMLTFKDGRRAQKVKYGGELFPSSSRDSSSSMSFLEFFQTDRETGNRKGIVAIDMEEL